MAYIPQSFDGHIYPGIAAVLLSCWWTWNTACCYYRCKYMQDGSFQSRPWYALHICQKRVLLDTIFKLACSSNSILMIYVNTKLKGLPAMSSENIQHISISSAYLMSGCIDILDYYKLMTFPNGINFMSLVVPAFVETFIFCQHLDGIQMRNNHMHVLMAYVSLGKLICAVIELVNPESIKAALGRCFFTLMAGTWFAQIGFSLFYEPWSNGARDYTEIRLSVQETKKSILIFNVYFVWHFFIDLAIFLSFILTVCKYFHRKSMLGCSCRDPDSVEGHGV